MTKPTRASEQQLIQPQIPPVPFYCQQETASQYRFYISTEIGEPERYHQMCQILRSVGERDTVFIHLNSPGGQLDSTVQIISAMKESKGDVITIADGVVASAATLLFLAGDGFIVNPHSLFMIHTFSGGAQGKGHEMEAQILSDVRWFNNVAVDFYEEFLTKSEIRRLLKGEDFWFTAEEVTKRIQRRVLHLQTKMDNERREQARSRIEAIGDEMRPLLSETQTKQLEKLIKCAASKVGQPPEIKTVGE